MTEILRRLGNLLQRRRWLAPTVQTIVFSVAFALYGSWQYHKGFDTGADSAICAFSVGMKGESAITEMDACRRIKNHDWIVDGFNANGTTP